MSPLSEEQEVALSEWERGRNVRVVAVPGAGKSRVMVEACRRAKQHRKTCLLLSYNRELCRETKAKLAEETHVRCLTFHGLCCVTLGPAPDDFALHAALEKEEGGGRKLRTDAILIDEAQDFRDSFLRLLHLGVEIEPRTQFFVVGDPDQMLYDYDEDDPAKVEYLTRAADLFPTDRRWSSVRFTTSFRLTAPMATLAGSMFGKEMAGRGEGDPVEVHTLSLKRGGGPLLLSLLRREVAAFGPKEGLEKVCILTPRLNGNLALREAINHLAWSGVPLYLQGVDGTDARVRKGKVVVQTWHSSKGTEKPVVIVFGLSAASSSFGGNRNPCFVALTRARERLILLQDEEDPLPLLFQTVLSMSASTRERTVRLFGPLSGKKGDAEMMKTETVVEVHEKRKERGVCLDGWRPKGTGLWFEDHVPLHDDTRQTREEGDEEENDEGNDEKKEEVRLVGGEKYEDLSQVYRLACLMREEMKETGRVRRLDDAKMPLRLGTERQETAIRNGNPSRFVSPQTEGLLPPFADSLLRRPIFSSSPLSDWCEKAILLLAWNEYHHTLLHRLPCSRWATEEGWSSLLEAASSRILKADEYDVRVAKEVGGRLFHCRCDAISKERGVLHYVWGEVSPQDRMAAGIRSAVEGSCLATIVSLTGEGGGGGTETIRVRDGEGMLERLADLG